MRLSRRFARTGAVAASVLVAGGVSVGDATPRDNPLLVSSTYLGGTGTDVVTAAVFGPDGALWIAGSSTSTDFPDAARPAGQGGGADAYVIRLDPATRHVLSAAWIGGSAADAVVALAFDAAGHAYVAGSMESTDFPSTGGLAGPGLGRPAAFVARLNVDATGFAWAYALGGSNRDDARALCFASNGDPIVVGRTTSVDFPFTGPLGAARGDRDFGDLFITRLHADGSGIVFSTFLGGNRADDVGAAAAIPGGGILLAGTTLSTWNFPAKGRIVATAVPGPDGFLVEIDEAGTEIRRGKYLGPTSVTSMSVSGGTLLLLGSSRESVAPLPEAPPASPGADVNALLLRIDAGSWTVTGGARYGGSDAESYLSMSTGPDGTVWLTGSTNSEDLDVPGAIRARAADGEDAFVASFDAADLSLRTATYLGGRGREIYEVVAAGPDGGAWALGSTGSGNFPLLDPVQDRTTDLGSYDLFLTRLTSGDAAALPGAPSALTAQALGGSTVRLDWTLGGGGETGVAIDRSDRGRYARVAVVSAGTTRWDDVDVVADHGYAYAVQALNAAGGSVPSNEAHAVTPATLALEVTKGRFRAGPFGFGGSLRLTGTIRPADPASAPLDLPARGFELVFFASFGPDVVIAVPPGDAGWKVKRNLRRWRSGSTQFRYDAATGAFDLRAEGHAPSVAEGSPLSIQVTSVRDAGTTANLWHPGRRRETRTP